MLVLPDKIKFKTEKTEKHELMEEAQTIFQDNLKKKASFVEIPFLGPHRKNVSRNNIFIFL